MRPSLAGAIASDRPLDRRIGLDRKTRLDVDDIAVVAMVAADTLIRSRLYVFASDDLRTALLAVILIVIVRGVITAVFAIRVAELILFAALIACFLAELSFFSTEYRREGNYNALMQMYGPLSFVAFSQALSRDKVELFVKTLFIAGVAYLCVYLVIAILNIAGQAPVALLDRMTLNDEERGNRIFLSGDVAAFVLFCSISGLWPRRVALIAGSLAVLAVGLSLSRVFIACIMLLAFLAMSRRTNRAIGVVSLLVFGSVTASLLYGIVDPSWNPFVSFAGDSSGSARSLFYDISRSYIWHDPIYGVGFPTSDEDLHYAVSNVSFSTSDLGVISIWCTFGAAGLILFLFSTYVLAFGFQRLEAPSSIRRCLHLTACFLVLYGCIAPLSWLNPGSLICGLSLAVFLKGRSQIRPSPR